MNKRVFFQFSSLLLISLLSCHQVKKPEAAIERENWIASFADSIKYYQDDSEKISAELSAANGNIGQLLDKFEYVKHPRQVTGYYILKGWDSKIPFTKTAIYARLNDDEQIELIATLSGGKFNQITASNGTENITSKIVPYDQALNYRQNGINTVCFSGGSADSIARFISMHESEKINIIFSEGNSKKTFSLPSDEKQMIGETWKVFEAKMNIRQLQKRLWINSRKIDTYRRMMDSADSVDK